MTATNVRRVEPGDRIVWHETGLAYTADASGWSAAHRHSIRGQAVTVTRALIEANTDRLGNVFLDLADDPDAQQARWGKVYFARLDPDAPIPRHLTEPVPGSVEASMAYDREHLAILSDRSLSDEERDAALRRIRTKFSPPSKQRSQGIRGNSGDPRLDRPRTGREER